MAEKNLGISILLDHYGAMLTDKQRDVIDLYYNQDLSLAEIAEHEGISRQGVRDNIKRGEAFLLEMEQKLHLAQKMTDLLETIETVSRLCDEIEMENRTVRSTGIQRRTTAIRQMLGACIDEYFGS